MDNQSLRRDVLYSSLAFFASVWLMFILYGKSVLDQLIEVG